jgi:glyoxylase-like metal-dependent hydrolase (beta-lactamase superfamily II)
MWNRLVLAVAIVAIAAASAFAAEAQNKNDLKRIADAMGAADLKSLEYTGGGVGYAVGQSPNPVAPWPRYYLKSFTRAINFETSSMRDELTRVQGENPPRGGGGQPISGEQRQVMLVSGTYAWNQPAKDAVPRLWEAADRQHQIWITPQGVIKAAMAHNAAVKTQTREGRKMTTISFIEKGKMRVNAYVNDKDMVERVESWYGHPVAGDVMVETHYLDYREFSGLKFPTKIIQTYGGFPALDLMVRGVKPNAAVDIQVPDIVRSNPVTVKSENAAEGVWYITGGSHHSVAIEMKDYAIVIEGPYGDERSVAVIAEVKKLIQGKPIKYLVNTHHHFDHSSGIRAYAAEGATIVTHEINRPYYEKSAMSRNFSPDRLAKSGKKPVFQTMGDNMVLTDGARTVELYQIAGNTHHDGLIMAYLRKEKLLIEADAYTPAAPDAPPPATPNPFSVNLNDNVRRLNLEIDRILPLHGRIVPYSELEKAIGKAPAG